MALAIGLWQVDHAGQAFSSLDTLVPTYLAKLPVDPFDRSHHALRFQPGAPVARLYSIGPDGVDDGGSMVNRKGESDRREYCTDRCFYLQPYTRPAD
jgi:hypothetical protein